jgi:hypothetical protein
MDGVKEEECPDALVEVVAAPSEVVELPAFFKERLDGGALTERIQRDIPLFPVIGYDVSQVAHEDEPPPFPVSSRSARSSSI